MIGVGTASADVAYVGGSSGSGPAEIIKTSNGGTTWSNCNASGALLFEAASAASDTNALLTGLAVDEYTLDGYQFKDSLAVSNAEGNRALTWGVKNSYGIAGSSVFPKAQGVGISHTAGLSFKWYDAGLDHPVCYGAFPSATIWYAPAGTFPSTAPATTPATPPACSPS